MNEKEARLLKIIKLEHDYWLYMGEPIPKHLNYGQWLKLFKQGSATGRLKLLTSWHKPEEKCHQKQELAEEMSPNYVYFPPILTGLEMVHQRTEMQMKSNTFHSMMYGPNIVFDFSFANDTDSKKSMTYLQRDLTHAICANRTYPEPFYISFCNFQPELWEPVENSLEAALKKNPIQMTSKSYLELFSQDRLVYITAEAPEPLREVDPDAVYILPTWRKGKTFKTAGLKRALTEGIRAARLPFEIME